MASQTYTSLFATWSLALRLFPSRRRVNEGRSSRDFSVRAAFGSGKKGKSRVRYKCVECGKVELRWWAQCPACRGEMEEEVEVDSKANDKAGGGVAVRMAERMRENLKASLMDRREQERFERHLLMEGMQSLSRGYNMNGSETAAEPDVEDDSEGLSESLWNSSLAKGGSSSRRARSHRNGSSSGSGIASASVSSSGWVTASESGRSRSLTDVFGSSGGANKGKQRIRLDGPEGAEISRVLGGGVVPGALMLVCGDPGVGKSTLLMMLAGMLASGASRWAAGSSHDDGSSAGVGSRGGVGSVSVHESEGEDDGESEGVGVVSRHSPPPPPPPPPSGRPVLYVSGEETEEQLALRAERLHIRAPNLFLFNASNLVDIVDEIIDLRPHAVVVDSIQTVYMPEATGGLGSPAQVRDCASALLLQAKGLNVPIFIVGHVTKAGGIAGPKTLEHIVDCVLHLEGDPVNALRLLHSGKNRFGPTDEVGVFEMLQTGLVAVPSPSHAFLSPRHADSEAASTAASSSSRRAGKGVRGGAAIAVTMQGSRPLLLEVQALCSRSQQSDAPPRRNVTGIDFNRLSLLLAILSKLGGLSLGSQDIFINVVGGVQMKEPAADLAIAVAVASSFLDRVPPNDCVFIGEIGLRGELRPVAQLERRVNEASKLGFRTCYVPRPNRAADANRLLALASEGKGGKEFSVVLCSSIHDVLQAAGLKTYSD